MQSRDICVQREQALQPYPGAIYIYKEQHYTTAYRNHKSAGEKLCLFRFFKCFFFFFFFFFVVVIFRIFSANTLQPVQKSLFN